MSKPASRKSTSSKTRATSNGRFEGPTFVAIVTALLLIPFLYKPFHIDDTLFVRIAEHIQEHPDDPFGFSYNWYGDSMPMGKITQNPPLACYMLAGFASMTGMNEFPLHIAMGLVAIATSLLSYSVAKQFCQNPTMAVVMSLFTPAYLVSAGNVMAEIPLLFFWILAIYATMRATAPRAAAWLWIAGIAASGAAMSKYFGVAVMPLIAVFWILRARRFSVHLLGLLLPVAVLAWWGYFTLEHYEVFHPLGAAEYSVEAKSMALMNRNFAHTLAFLGFCFLWPALILLSVKYLPRKTTVALLSIATASVLFDVGMAYTTDQQALAKLMEQENMNENVARGFTPAIRTAVLYSSYKTSRHGFILWGAALLGGLLVAMMVHSCWVRRDIDTLFLGLWFFGTFVFTAFVNWTVNARSVLPAVLPAVLLFLRWIETLPARQQIIGRVKVGLVPVLLITLMVAAADYETASAGKTFAQDFIGPIVKQGQPVYFVGHWGFQYYMEEEGAIPVEIHGNQFVSPGDLIVYPHNNTNINALNLPTAQVYEQTYPSKFKLHPMSTWARTGFYSSQFGPLPFSYDPRNICDRYVVERFLPAQ